MHSEHQTSGNRGTLEIAPRWIFGSLNGGIVPGREYLMRQVQAQWNDGKSELRSKGLEHSPWPIINTLRLNCPFTCQCLLCSPEPAVPLLPARLALPSPGSGLEAQLILKTARIIGVVLKDSQVGK